MVRISGVCGCCNKYYQGDSCPHCEAIIHNSRTGQEFEGDGHWNRGLGMQIRTRGQYKSELKKRGLEEVGNEKAYVDPVRYEKARQTKIDAQYRQLDRKIAQALQSGDPHILEKIGAAWN